MPEKVPKLVSPLLILRESFAQSERQTQKSILESRLNCLSPRQQIIFNTIYEALKSLKHPQSRILKVHILFLLNEFSALEIEKELNFFVSQSLIRVFPIVHVIGYNYLEIEEHSFDIPPRVNKIKQSLYKFKYMYPQLSEAQKSIISLYLESVRMLNENKDSVHTPVLKIVHELLLDEMQESLKNHSMSTKIQSEINNRESSFNKLMSKQNNNN
jgi:hypothetical protein